MTSHVYCLRLEHGKIYVGYSPDVQTRVAEHFLGRGSLWTQMHRPVEVLSVQEGGREMEDVVTIAMMAQYGWKQVRGGSWSRPELRNVPKPLTRAYSKQRRVVEEAEEDMALELYGHCVSFRSAGGEVVAQACGRAGKLATLGATRDEALEKMARAIESRGTSEILLRDDKDAAGQSQSGADDRADDRADDGAAEERGAELLAGSD